MSRYSDFATDLAQVHSNISCVLYCFFTEFLVQYNGMKLWRV